ncbi:MAG: Bax inhibitor-1/YccA family protein [Alphaproteobacteria bacterium]|nr:MAG: Bax inhibitor-1/YccA family protein [Alphaproteobacteria bacterium]
MLSPDRRTMTRSQAEAAQIDTGLRAHMLRVYNYMASGVALTGIVAMAASSSPALMNAIFGTPLMWVVMLAPLAFVMVLSFGIHRLSLFASQALFWLFAAVMGLSLSTIFLIYTGESIARVFFITAAAFGALSLYGYTTKRDISGWGSFLFMGLIGIIIAGVVNLFMQSSAMQFAISVIGVLVFAGLTAYDTQKIKNEYSELHDYETSGKLAVMGALRLYLDFINLMMMLLHLFGNRR